VVRIIQSKPSAAGGSDNVIWRYEAMYNITQAVDAGPMLFHIAGQEAEEDEAQV